MIKMIKIQKVCPFCKESKIHEFPISAEEFMNGQERRKNGELIQDVFPQLTANQREVLISGICPECWDETFGY